MVNKVMTVLEARVAQEHWAALGDIFTHQMATLPPQMEQSLLVQDPSQPDRWQVIAIWRSRDALNEYRQSVETPGGVLMFRSFGAEPTLTILEIACQHQGV